MRALLFDLDDTLVCTDARVWITRDGKSFAISPSEFTVFDRRAGDAMDFSEFDDLGMLLAGRVVPETSAVMQEAAASGVHVGIVTARNTAAMVREFVQRRLGVTVQDRLLHAVSSYPGMSVPEKKAEAFRRMMASGYTEFIYYEDCVRNVRAVQSVCAEGGCKVHPFLVDLGPPVTLNRLDGRTPP